MKFEMNNRTWEIKELSQEEIRKHIVDYKYDGQPQDAKKLKKGMILCLK